MKPFLEITSTELEKNFEFIVDLCYTNQQPFRVLHNGKYVMLLPVPEKNTVDPDIVDQVEELKQEWMQQVEAKNSSQP
ncbi:Phd-like antitoxin [Synechococcus phage S-SSM4]|jgi:hypothetical protein|uniref:Uncharacterized protein n=1 Tax=Synechococcus phage S-SSM4 TaxID=536466 RepID=M1T221_9CAUD|nr:Phd-like antitoxin [Synechococcus phage S-SSM4]AGG54070.1 hypothetical protein CYXG_00006 [Synechococcus phage S-SSM4]AGG54353.1 hypothetical protein CYWG_00069 [Cyanophage S-SSM6b]|tara:strand:+ start:486 stop:719 length:234 start_codon:yes stop_codon:yes gene_type:complete